MTSKAENRSVLARGKRFLTRLPLSSRLTSLSKAEAGILIAAFICATLLWTFIVIAEEVMEGDTHKVDMAILMSLRTTGAQTDLLGPPWFEEMMRDLTALGSYAFIILLVTAAVGYLLLVRKRALALLVLGAVLGGMLISNLLKTGFDRPRPDLDHAARVFTPSFPSGHAMLSAVTFLTLGALLTRANVDWRAKVYFLSIAIILTIIVGSSRVYLGVHFPSDVIAGWCVGSAWALICWSTALWLQSRGQVEQPSADTEN